MSKHQIVERAIFFSIFSSIALAIIKGIVGYFGNSYALITDAIESTSDVFSSLLLLMGIKYSHRPADNNHPYGHGRIEPLITFIIVGFLIASAVVIAYKSIQNIQTPHELPKVWTLYVLGTIIAWKEISYQIVRRKSIETNSSSLHADAWHHRSDAITSVAAFIGISIAVYFGQGYETADDWAALLASFFILYNSYLLFRPAFGEIMDENMYEDLILQIRSISKTVEGVRDTEKCFVRKVGLIYHIDLHASVSSTISVKEGHDISHRLKDTLQDEIPELGNVLIHIEPDE